MNAAQLLEIIHKKDSLESNEVELLEKLEKNFPYFLIPHILTARHEYQLYNSKNSFSRGYAAINSPDRIWLKALIENNVDTVYSTKDNHEIASAPEKRTLDLIKSISKKEIKLESIKEIEARENNQNLAFGGAPIKFNLSAATMRLTIVIDVKYINAENEEETLISDFTFFKDYDPATTTFLDMEKKLLEEIFTIIQDIFISSDSSAYFPTNQSKNTIQVNASQFLEIIQKSDSCDRSDMLQLQKVSENFPYFQIPHVLTARYEIQKNNIENSWSIGYAAITSPNRIWLKTLVEKTEVATTSPQVATPKPEEKKEVIAEIIEVEAKPEPPKPKPRRRKPPKDDLIEMIKKKDKKEILDEKKKEQIDLIKAFSKKSIKLATIKEIEANQNTENLAAASTQINDNMISESYAKILANQGKKQLSKEIYEKLVLKFPDKRAYFADLIEKLKD
ncbi:hypothetical protein [Algoriphagus winogradskyi]|uniref:Uncharacterized protein n=1 Tax=Algoriphagus winogradskyi TaxID=237017 RepID=A0ABY1NC95_9BACT|nr:hypothetical protein [Algoriphagus winogradskyi]SMP06281.1 hypothetical protein SAMN06265367_101450 [Algoriphagus winogradskyi]